MQKNRIMKFQVFIMATIFSNIAFGQSEKDTGKVQNLKQITVTGQKFDNGKMPDIQGTYIFSGKKTEVISLQEANANIVEKTPRQIFAKIPGVFVYDMDGTGNQTNISTRGLDPHRGWEFNIRKNGIIVNSDVYGYPASHFSMPLEAVERIELVRGTGSLQYGAQFGGMLNYVTKQGDTTKKLSIESINSMGSYGLLSTFNAVGGKIGKFEYYAYASKRLSEGYRQNSKSDYDGQFLMLKYQITEGVSLKAELARSNYLYQIPGPLTDSMFDANPRQATRSRNYFSPKIYVPSISFDWKLGNKTRISFVTSAVLGRRRSIQFDKPANVVDKIDPITLTYANRQVDIDHFYSYTSELRLLQHYSIGKTQSTLAAGIQVFNNDLHRQQVGKGSTGSDFDLTITGNWGRDLHFKTQNLAIFAENKFDISKKWSINAGIRFETGTSKMSGTINYLDAQKIPNTINHQFPLLGLSSNYCLTETQHIYVGFSQAYRPVIFKDIIPQSVYEKADPNLKDAYGYNLEMGYKGSFSDFRWDFTLFRLQYNNRLGSLSLVENGNYLLYRTNIGNAATQGIEAFGEYSFKITEGVRCNVFSSTAYFDGRYQDAQVKVGNENRSVKGNQIESVPNVISRNGVSFKFKKLSVSTLFSYTSKTYADALNTEIPSANGAIGLVPAYTLLDINATYRVYENVTMRLSINNLTDKKYFTKRPTFYPGPGIWSSDGRSMNVTMAIKL